MNKPMRERDRASPSRQAVAGQVTGGSGGATVLVIDDHPIVFAGCRRALEDAGVSVFLEARDIVSGYRLYRRQRPDVVIVDLAMQEVGLGGLSLIRRIHTHDPKARILVFSMHSDPTIVMRALEAGATGYVIKDAPPTDLLDAFKKVRTGAPYLSKDLAMQVAMARTPARSDPFAELSQGEIQMLSLLTKGKHYGSIAEELGVSYKTIANVSVRLKKKLNARNLPDLVRIGVQLFSRASYKESTRD
jgi:two-component system, NarL family, invasion response regulator UvrY